MEEISKEPHVEDNYIENTSEDEAPNFKTPQNTYMVAHQIQEKWETTYPFAIYTAKQKGWICNICAEYGEGTEQWITAAVKLNQHPTRTFESQLGKLGKA